MYVYTCMDVHIYYIYRRRERERETNIRSLLSPYLTIQAFPFRNDLKRQLCLLLFGFSNKNMYSENSGPGGSQASPFLQVPVCSGTSYPVKLKELVLLLLY